MARITNLPFLSTLTTDLILPVVDESVSPPTTRKLEVTDLITLVNDAAIQIVGPSGPSGPRGNVGAQGPQGVTGPQGVAGFIGSKGDTGPQGPQGYTGSVGPSGIDGPSGAAGPQGPQGPSGPSGVDGIAQPGPSGAEGPQGPEGPQGVTGPQGPQGAEGPQGPTGYTGSVGPSGVAGSITYTVTNNGNIDYIFEGNNDPTITLVRGFSYTFDVNASGYPMWIKTAQVTGTGNAFTTGITNNGTDVGSIVFNVPIGAPDTLYYISENDAAMAGTFTIVTLGSSGSIVGELNDLTDVTLSTPSTGETLYFNGTNWVNSATSVASGTGPQGPQGPAGIDGTEGPQGPSGPSGPGLTTGGTTGQILSKASDSDYDTAWIDAPTGGGAVGPQGPQGPAGNDGGEGPQGPSGPTGADSTVAGPQGDPGPSGPTGPSGPEGPASTLAGPSGPTGPSGADGLDGAAGPQGPQGTPGTDGPTGPSGPSGVDGGPGPSGPSGPSGPAGQDGSDGPSGPSGPSGVDGPQGPTGPAGDITNPYPEILTVSTSTGATSTTTGALIVYGGAGIGENLYVGGFTEVDTLSVVGSLAASSTGSAAVIIGGGVGINNNIIAGGNISSILPSGELLTLGDSSDGSDKWLSIDSLYGNLEIGRNGNTNAYINSNMAVGALELIHNSTKIQIDANDQVLIPQTTVSTASNSGALVVAGGVGINGSLNVSSATTFSQSVSIENAYDSIGGLKLKDNSGTEVAIATTDGTAAWRLNLPASAGTLGQVLTTDGVGVTTWADPVASSSGIFTVTNTTQSISTDSGALQIQGGAGIYKDVWIGGDVFVNLGQDLLAGASVNVKSGTNGSAIQGVGEGDGVKIGVNGSTSGTGTNSMGVSGSINNGLGSASGRLGYYDGSAFWGVHTPDDLYVGGSTTIGNVLTLLPLTSEPAPLVAGMLVVADGTTWDPVTKGTGLPYPVFYDGSGWNALY